MVIVLLRPAIITQVIADVVKVMDIALLKPATLPQVILEVVDLDQVLPGTRRIC